MCGIFGIWGDFDDKIIYDATKTLSHRGPDALGFKIYKNKEKIGLGHTRLKIIDLSDEANQPMEDGHLAIIHNGEIFNYREIKKELEKKGHKFKTNSDTEVILKAYKEWDKNFIHKLRGMFAFAIYDRQKQKILLYRDKIGVKPLYYAFYKNNFIFSSEIKAILKSGVKADADSRILQNPFWYPCAPFTGFKNIYKLKAGHYLEFDGKRLKIEKYWDIEPKEIINNLNEAKENLKNLLLETIKLYLIADVPMGVLLSGGLDSSLILALVSKFTDKITTFTIKYKKEDIKFEAMPDDSLYARKVAEKFNSNHIEIEIEPKIADLLPKIVYHMDEPLSDPASINVYLICKEARKMGIKVLLSGMGADEIFGGYRYYMANLISENYRKITDGFLNEIITNFVKNLKVAGKEKGIRQIRWLKRFLILAHYDKFYRMLANFVFTSKHLYKKIFNGKYESLPHFLRYKEMWDKAKNLSYLNRMCFCDFKIYLTDHNLNYTDKASSATGVEIRPPLIDHKICEFAFNIAPELKIKNFCQKYILKKVAEKFLPHEIIYRPKAPFGAPLRAWVRKDLKEMIDDILTEKTLKERGYNVKEVKAMIKADREGKEDFAFFIWMLLTREIWYKIFIDKT